MLTKPVMRGCIPPSHRNIHFMYLGLAQVISKAFVNKVSKGAKIRNRYNQVPHLTQDTNGKVTNSQ